MSSTSKERPASRAKVSAARISAAPRPRLRARRCTSIFETSARCGWFSGRSSTSCTVPTMPCSSSTTNRARPPAATSSATRLQNAARLLRRQRMHEADRGAALDAIDQQLGQAANLGVGHALEAPDRRQGLRGIVAAHRDHSAAEAPAGAGPAPSVAAAAGRSGTSQAPRAAAISANTAPAAKASW